MYLFYKVLKHFFNLYFEVFKKSISFYLHTKRLKLTNKYAH